MIRVRDRRAARHALKDLTGVGVKLPKSVADAAAVLDRIEAEAPTEPAPNAVSEAILNDEPADVIDALIAQHLGYDHHQQQHMRAMDTAGARILTAILSEADDIHAQLATQAGKLIEDIHAAAEVNAPVDQLVRDGRTKDARLVATADANVAQLQTLYGLRNQYLARGVQATSVGDVEAGVWEDPELADHHHRQQPTTFGTWAIIIRAGGRLWFPTPEQAREVAAPIAERRAEAAAEAAAAARGFGTAIFG